jgi:hypothetical protein
VKGANDGCWVHIRDVAVHTAESLYVLVQSLAISLWDHLKIVGLTGSLMAFGKGTNKLIAKI